MGDSAEERLRGRRRHDAGGRVKIVFEGFCDTRSGWDFDAPLFMVHPVMQMHDVGSGVDEADRIVEEYIEAISLGDSPVNDEFLSRATVLRGFGKAKAGSDRYVYWRQEVVIPDDIDWDADDAFERVQYGALQKGAATTPGEG